MQSIIMDSCWVCGSRDGLNDHHVVPQAYGGTNGPQVTLCASHHTVIHQVALTEPHRWTEQLDDPRTRGKLEQLVTIIYRARIACKGVEKPMQINHKLNMSRSRKLRELKVLLGVSSLNAALDKCIDVIYDQLTPLKK